MAATGYQPTPARNPSLPTLVGLLILILCFFVVLTSISLKDRVREHSVMVSLQQTFSNAGEARPSNETPPVDQASHMLGDLHAKLNAEVPLVSGVQPATGDALLLKLPRNLVFVGDGPGLTAGFPHILAETLAALKNGPADYAYEVEIGITAPLLDDRAVALGNAVAAQLRASGFANDAAVVSLEPGSGQTVDLTVRLRPDARLKSDDIP